MRIFPAIIAIVCFALSRNPCQAVPTIIDTQARPQATDMTLSPGGQFYLFGMSSGGGMPSGLLTDGNVVHLENTRGFTAAQLSIGTKNANSYTTQCGVYAMGGVGVSNVRSVQGFYGTSTGVNAQSASVRFILNAPAAVVVLGLAGSQKNLELSGIDNFVTDAQSHNSSGLVIAHSYLPSGTYTVQETTTDLPDPFDPGSSADLLAVFIFSDAPGSAKSDNPEIPLSLSSQSSVIPNTVQSTLQLADGTTVSGDIVSSTENGVVFRTDGDKYSDRLPWIKFSQEGLKQLAQNPKIEPLVEPFIEAPNDNTLAIASNSEIILGRWDVNVVATLLAMVQTRTNVPTSEMAALRVLWFPTYAKTVLVASTDGQVFLENLPHLKVQPNQRPTLDTATWQGQWKHDGDNYDLSLSSNGEYKSMTAQTDGVRLTLKDGKDTLIFDRENAQITNTGGVGSTIPSNAGEKPVVQPPNVPPSQPIQKSSSHRHIPLARYLGWCVAGLVIIGMAIIIIRLIMPRRSNHDENNPTNN
jgi:hypothetical protein